MSDSYPATREEVVQTFLHIPYRHLTAYNWDTGPAEHRDEWNCNDETYINGIILTLDFDYYMGYLIEVVDRTTGYLTYHAIVTFHGRHPETGHQEHDSMIYPEECGTFFERTPAADQLTICQWALPRIYGMVESYTESRSPKDS